MKVMLKCTYRKQELNVFYCSMRTRQRCIRFEFKIKKIQIIFVKYASLNILKNYEFSFAQFSQF